MYNFQSKKFLAKTNIAARKTAKYFVKNSHHFMSFDIVTVFINIPSTETLTFVKEKHNMRKDLIQHFVKSTYFIYNGQWYRQLEGVLYCHQP